jgi:ribonuclease HI
MSCHTIQGFFDGACEPRNPGGHGAWGALVTIGGKVVWQGNGYVGFGKAMSSNVAEYAAVAEVLRQIQEMEGAALILGDSKLVVQQLRGEWRVRDGLYVPYYREAKALLDLRRQRTTFQWIPRESNSACDELAKSVLRGRGIKIRFRAGDGDHTTPNHLDRDLAHALDQDDYLEERRRTISEEISFPDALGDGQKTGTKRLLEVDRDHRDQPGGKASESETLLTRSAAKVV